MIWNYKVLNLVELYNFDISFVFIRLHLKMHEFICTVQVFKDGWLSQPPLKFDFYRRLT
jgi:hypothetical protein